MRALKMIVILAALTVFSAGIACAKTANHSGTYGLKSETAKGWLKLDQVKGAMHQFSVMVVTKDGATCNLDGMIELEDGVGVFRGTFQKCNFSLYFKNGAAMIDSAKTCDQCGPKATIDGTYVKGFMKK